MRERGILRRTGVTERYRTEACAKIGRGVRHVFAETVGERIGQVTDGGEKLACLHCVCYKFVAEFGLTTKCLSSIFLRAKSTASWCTTVQVWAERPPTCSGSTTTRGKIRKARWFRWRRRRTARCSSTFCHWIWERCADSRRAFIYIPCLDRFFTKLAAS